MRDDATFTLRAMEPTDGPGLAALGEQTPETGAVSLHSRFEFDPYQTLLALRPGTIGVVAEAAERAGLVGLCLMSFGKCWFEGAGRALLRRRSYHHGADPSRPRSDHEVETMDEQDVRARAQAVCDALAAGDVERARIHFSPELQRNLGEVLALMPLPANEVVIDSIEHGGSGYNVVIRMAGEVDEVLVQTRWKDRDGEPRMVEASHLASTPVAPADDAPDEPADATDGGA